MTEDHTARFAAAFPRATMEDWRRLVDAMLKGAPFSRLQSRSYDGLTIAPLYERAATTRAMAARRSGGPWTVMQRVDHPDPAAANAQARDDLENGATGLLLVCAGSASAHGFGLDGAVAALGRALDGLPIDGSVVIDVDLAPFATDVPQRLADVVRQRLDPAAANVRFGYDPVTALAISGRIPLPWEATAQALDNLISKLVQVGFKGPFAAADGRVIHGAGGSEAQELAYALSSAVAYLRALNEAGMPLEVARGALYFRFAADADELMTMAKLRAARKLWAGVEQACGLKPQPILVAAETAWRMMTQRDAYTNMLRATIAAAAAGFGGADSITVLPHALPLGLSDPLARRIARNIQLVLLEEANLYRVADPAAGAGAVEAVTQELTAAAWALFREIEQAGGVWRALEKGLIQQKVAAVRAQRQDAIAQRREILTGATEFPDLAETRPAVLPVSPVPKPPEPAGGTAVALPSIRLAGPFEALRDRSDWILARTGARPRIFVATLGDSAEFTGRANFARNFFAAGGIEATSAANASASLADAFRMSGAALACLCGSDAAYDREADAAAASLKAAGARHIYLIGGSDRHRDALRAAGVQTVIDEKAGSLATLQTAYDILGESQGDR